MDREIYLHAINSVPDDYYYPDETNKTLLQILKRRALLSAKLQRRRPTGGFNGRDYVIMTKEMIIKNSWENIMHFIHT